jgi:hypothetical protein
MDMSAAITSKAMAHTAISAIPHRATITRVRGGPSIDTSVSYLPIVTSWGGSGVWVPAKMLPTAAAKAPIVTTMATTTATTRRPYITVGSSDRWGTVGTWTKLWASDCR